jgi:hypothetical protein
VLRAFTEGADDHRAILLTDLNWQVQNGLSYFTKVTRPEVADAHLPDVLFYAPVLVRDNRAIGREVLASQRAQRELTSSFGPLLSVRRDERTDAPPLANQVRRIARGTPYVLAVLRSSREFDVDETDLDEAAAILGGTVPLERGDYFVLAGVAGAPPALVVDAMKPFRRSVDLDGVAVTVRMDSWIAMDTIRRMGFGHVIAGRRHTLIIERGISFVAFDATGRPLRTVYASNIFAPLVRYQVGEP